MVHAHANENDAKPLVTKMKYYLSGLFACGLLPLVLWGQPKPPSTFMASLGVENYRVTHIGVENGLSQGSVYTIFKDSYGFMWFSSQEGLNRYDGLNFRVFRPDEADSTALWGSNVVGIIEDPSGDLWIGTEVCLNRYDRNRGKFQHIFSIDDRDAAQGGISYPFYVDSREVWLFNDRGGIVAYDYQSDERRVVEDRFLYQQNNLAYHSILRTSGGDMWLRSDVGLIRLPAQGGEPEYYFSSHPRNLRGEPSTFYSYHYDAKEEVLWLGGEGEIFRFDLVSKRVDAFAFSPSSMVFDLHLDNEGRVWVGTESSGLQVFDPQSEVFRELDIQQYHLPLRALATVFVDEQGVVWVCSDPQGLYKIIPNYRAIQLLRHDPLVPGGLPDSYVRSFAEDRDGRIWVGTQHGGAAVWDPEKGSFDSSIRQRLQLYIPDRAISSLIVDQSGRIWIGTENGLACYDPVADTVKVMHQYTDSAYRLDNYIRSLLEVASGSVFFTSETGLYQADYAQQRVRRLPVFQDTSLTTLFSDSRGRLFISSYFNGFYVLEKVGRQWRRLGHFLPGLIINCFYLDSAGNRLWLGTNKGVWEFACREEPFELKPLRQFAEKDGLPSSYVYAILPDEEGSLWLSSNRGISKFDPGKGTFNNLGPKDGLQGYEFNTNAYLQASDGVLYFGGVRGMNFFVPGEVGKVPNPTPRVLFTGLQVSGRQSENRMLNEEQTSLSLAFSNNTFFLSFVAPEYFCDGEIKYRYRLTNYEKNWSEPGYANTVRYIRVPPGEYEFQVQAMNCDGVWSEEPTLLALTIRPPWWRTPLASLAYGSGLILLILAGYQLYSWRKLERQESLHLKEMNEYRNRFYTNITHEFRTPLTSILGMGERVEGQPEVRDLILRNGRRLLDLINQILEISRLEAGQEDLQLLQADVQQFIRYLAEPFALIAAGREITLSMELAPRQFLMDFDPPKLERIVVNLLSNALKFTPPYGEVTLESWIDDRRQWFWLRVTDTGPGIEPGHLPHIFERFYRGGGGDHASGTGIGLALVRELVLLMGGEVDVESKKGEGTAFRIKLPVSRQAVTTAVESDFEVIGKGAIPAAQAAEITPVSSENTNAQKPVVLLVEDNADVVTYLKLILEPKYEFSIAGNGRQGLEMAFSLVPDLIISDIMMPEIDGYQLCHNLKNDERTSHIPIILLTARAGVSDRIAGLARGADAYLEKPFHEAELLVRVDQLLQLRRSLQQHYRREFVTGADTKIKPESATKRESSFLARVRKIIRQQLDDPAFSVTDLCDSMKLSQSQLYRKLKALTGKSPHQLISDYRMNVAEEKMRNTSLPVKEVAFQCGFNDPDYFSRLFREYYELSPTEYRRQKDPSADPQHNH